MKWSQILQQIRDDQRDLDQRIAAVVEDYAQKGGRVYCAKGCRNCCNLVVNATLPEAMLVAEQISDRQREKLRAHVLRLVAAMERVVELKDYLRAHRRVVGHCPFLEDDGSCGVYSARPFSCRALLSTRNKEWCAVDFADLHPAERQAFMSGLDRSAVAFPTHYLASPQRTGLALEEKAVRAMKDRFGFSLRGNLTVQVALLVDHRLADLVGQGLARTLQVVQESALSHPLLLEFD